MTFGGVKAREVAIALSKSGKGRRLLFKRNLPEIEMISEPLKKVAVRLSSMGYRDFPDRQLVGPATHLLNRQAKLLRPALVLAGAVALGEDPDRFLDLAAAVEILHTASLVHDDIIDKDITRRGVATVHAKYGKETAILAGDALIAKAVQLASQYGSNVMQMMSKTAIDMCAGELLDYAYQQKRKVPDMKTYLRMAGLKSAQDMASSCALAAICTNNKAAKSMQEAGKSLGIAFQIRDDIIEMVDAEERRRNGGVQRSGDFKPNIVKTLAAKLGKSRHEAIDDAVELNNYFVDGAMSLVADSNANAVLAKYIDFVRIRSE